MSGIVKLFNNLSGVFGIIALVLIILEWGILVITKTIKSSKEGWVNILSYMLDSIPYIFLGKIVILGIMTWVYEYRIFTLGFDWYIWIFAYFAYDFMFYLVHVLGHQVRFFWCIHGVHHTAKEMKLTVAARTSIIGFIYFPLTVLCLPIFGFDPFMIFIVEVIAKLYGVYEHINEKFIGKQDVLEKLFVTPSVHRVHHSSNPIYLDRNYGETFSIWDKIFGTFQTELKEEKPIYGVMGDNIDSESFSDTQLSLWKDLWRDMASAPKLLDKIKYLIMPLGWNHINGGKTSHHYRSEALAIYESKKKSENKKSTQEIELNSMK
jgi:sterol desaturase/sphingolipid hydroxylase (fatty acid hydroxylase superfamily)